MALNVSLSLSTQLGPHLKALRKLRKLSQEGLGKLVGVSQTRIAAIEANPGVVSVDQLVRLCRALGADLILRTTASTDTVDHAAHRDISPGNLLVLTAGDNAPRLQYIARALGVPLHDLVVALEKQFPDLGDDELSKVDVAALSPNQVAKLADDIDVKEPVMTKILRAVAKRLRETEGTVFHRPPAKGSW